MHEIDLKKYSVRTDLVVDILGHMKNQKGVISKEEKIGDIIVADVSLEENNALSKKKGRYITILFPDATDQQNKKKLEEVIFQYLRSLLEEKGLFGKSCLVVGLGNRESTPDSLGPKVASSVLVTRYLFELPDVSVEDGYSSVSSIIPGVSGTTGIESSDIILGIVQKTKPDFILAVDALASSSIERINRTIQMTDTGIHPGSGVGNKRREISFETIGIPVFAIGVPTVIDGVTIVSDTISYMMKQFSYQKENFHKPSSKLATAPSKDYLEYEENLTKEEKEKLLGMVGNLSEEEMKSLIFEVLTPIGQNLMVTVKEIDFTIEEIAKVLTSSINRSLHNRPIE